MGRDVSPQANPWRTERFGRPDVAPDLLLAKADAIRASVARGNPEDNLKGAAGDIYNAAKRLFADRKLGSDARAFMKGVCAPLIRPPTAIHDQLPRDIFG